MFLCCYPHVRTSRVVETYESLYLGLYRSELRQLVFDVRTSCAPGEALSLL